MVISMINLYFLFLLMKQIMTKKIFTWLVAMLFVLSQSPLWVLLGTIPQANAAITGIGIINKMCWWK